MTIEINTNWDNIPHTNPKATVVRHRKALDTLAVRVQKAELRLATLTDVFEVADIAMPFSINEGILTVKIKCLWYETKPKEAWFRLKLLGDWELIRNYSGKVADNIE